MPSITVHNPAKAAAIVQDLHDSGSDEESDEKIAKKAQFFKSYLTDGNNKPNWRKLKEECCDAATGNYYCPYPDCSRSVTAPNANPQDWKKTYDHVRYHFRSLGLGNLLGGRSVKEAITEERRFVRPKSPKKKARQAPVAPLPEPAKDTYSSALSQEEDEDVHVEVVDSDSDSDNDSDMRSVLLSDVENSSGIDSFSEDEDVALPRPPTILVVNRKRKLEDLYHAPLEPQPLKHFRTRTNSFLAVDRITGVASLVDTELPMLFPEAESSCRSTMQAQQLDAGALQHIYVYTVPMIY